MNMEPFPEIRRIQTDTLGSGVAGLMGVVGAIRSGVTPMIATKGTYASGSSSMARGGHSLALGHSDPADNAELFFEDINVGGDGYAMAYRAGAKLIDMEFIDYQIVTAAPAKLAGYPPFSTGLLGGGGHFRIDYPDRDDENFLGNNIVWREDGKCRIELRPVPGRDAVAPPPGEHSTGYDAVVPDTDEKADSVAANGRQGVRA